MHTTAREGAREGLASGQLNAGTQPLSRYIYIFFFFSHFLSLFFSEYWLHSLPLPMI